MLEMSPTVQLAARNSFGHLRNIAQKIALDWWELFLPILPPYLFLCVSAPPSYTQCSPESFYDAGGGNDPAAATEPPSGHRDEQRKSCLGDGWPQCPAHTPGHTLCEHSPEARPQAALCRCPWDEERRALCDRGADWSAADREGRGHGL